MELSKADESTILAALSNRASVETWDNSSFEAYTHMKKARRKLQEECPDGCFLMRQDTLDVMAKDKKFLVLAPPAYDMVTVLDKSHYMFAKNKGSKECAGLFRATLFDHVPAHKFAVDPQNSQAESPATHPGVWYKVTPALVVACQKINDQVASFTYKSKDPKLSKFRKKMIGYKKAIHEIEQEMKKFCENSDSSDVDLPEDGPSAKKRKRDKVLYHALDAGQDKLEERMDTLRCEMGEWVAKEREKAEDSDGEE